METGGQQLFLFCMEAAPIKQLQTAAGDFRTSPCVWFVTCPALWTAFTASDCLAYRVHPVHTCGSGNPLQPIKWISRLLICSTEKENPYEDVDLKRKSLVRKSCLFPEGDRSWSSMERKLNSPPQVQPAGSTQQVLFFCCGEMNTKLLKINLSHCKEFSICSTTQSCLMWLVPVRSRTKSPGSQKKEREKKSIHPGPKENTNWEIISECRRKRFEDNNVMECHCNSIPEMWDAQHMAPIETSVLLSLSLVAIKTQQSVSAPLRSRGPEEPSVHPAVQAPQPGWDAAPAPAGCVSLGQCPDGGRLLQRQRLPGLPSPPEDPQGTGYGPFFSPRHGYVTAFAGGQATGGKPK